MTRIVARRHQADGDDGSGWHFCLTDLRVLKREPVGHFHGGVIAQHLFDVVGDALRFTPQSLLQVSIQVTTGEAGRTPTPTQPIPLIAVAQFLALAEVINSVWRVIVFRLYAALRQSPATAADAFD